MKINDVISVLQQWAPPALQESYDNSTLIVGDSSAELTGVLVSLDCTEEIVQEAIDKNLNMVVAHHPIVFKGLKSLTGKNYVERTVLLAIKNDIAIYSIHTNLDNVNTGVNKKICNLIGLQNCRILAPKSDTLTKLVTFIPKDKKEEVLEKMYSAGAGHIGNYEECSFQTNGIGTFKPSEGATPYTGEVGRRSEEKETRVELIFQSHQQTKILSALKKAHPYEEVAYYLTDLNNENQNVGSGMVGELGEETNIETFFHQLKKTFDLKIIKHTRFHKTQIKRVAVCGGSGSFLLNKAIRSGADVFVTSDFKYHEYFDADDQITIADIGHYESEAFTKELIYDFLKEKIANIAVNLTERVTNPIKYF